MTENGAPDKTDTVDPRVHVELERLNSATDEINRLEVDLDEARASFRQLLCDSTSQIEQLRGKLGTCVEKAKPYYEARFNANETLKETRLAAGRYEKANSAHSAAREMVYLAEQGLGGRTLDPAWQEMLNHATQRVNDAEVERSISESEHRLACVKHETANMKVKDLQKELKRAILKSRLSIRRSLLMISNLAYRHDLLFLPFYEMKAHYNLLMEKQKLRVQKLEHKVATAKYTYADALKNLEEISDEIHRTRNKLVAINEAIAKNPDNTFTPESDDFDDEFKLLPSKLSEKSTPSNPTFDSVNGYKDLPPNTDNKMSQSGEWTEINLRSPTPPDEPDEDKPKPKLFRQKTLPNPKIENELSFIKNKLKLDSGISGWISRSSSASNTEGEFSEKQPSLDNILGPTGERVKEILNHGMMMLSISSLTERRNSEPKAAFTERIRKTSSPIEKGFVYLSAGDEESSDTESVSSVDMLSEEQVSSLMLDKAVICEEVLGAPISAVISSSVDGQFSPVSADGRFASHCFSGTTPSSCTNRRRTDLTSGRKETGWLADDGHGEPSVRLVVMGSTLGAPHTHIHIHTVNGALKGNVSAGWGSVVFVGVFGVQEGFSGLCWVVFLGFGGCCRGVWAVFVFVLRGMCW